MMPDYADSIAFLGQWGRFQKTVFFLLCLSIVPNGFGAFSLVFLTDVPAHHCRVLDANLTEDWRNSAIPIQVVDGKQELSRCSRYRLDVVRNLSAEGLVPGRDVNLTRLEQEGCVDGWSYSTDIYRSTIVSEFHLVCSDKWKRPLTATVFFLGSLLGALMGGQLSDRFGRKPVLFATIAVQTVFTFAQVYASSWIMFTILLFINGLGQIANYVAALVLGAETLTGNIRVLFSSLGTNLGFAVGYMMLPAFAYFIRDWRYLLVALSVPGLAYIPLWWLIPESPRWLLSQGRVEEAEAIMRKAAKMNKVQAPRNIFVDYSVNKANTDLTKRHNALDLLRKRSLRITTLLLCFVSFTMLTGYYGLSFNTSNLHEDPFISCFISAAVEVPAYITSWLALQYLPRRVSVIGCLLLGAVPLFFIQVVPQNLPNVSLALEMVGKFGFTTGTSMMFAYSAELYPTVLRTTGTGISSTVSRLGSCIAPFVLQLRIYLWYLPYVTFGTLAVVSVFAAFLLPESFGHPLPDTIQQMQKRKRIKCPCSSGNKMTQEVAQESNMIL